jgi:hypothetical protein
MKEHDELISAAESVLGFVFGDKMDCTREHAGLEPMVPLRFRDIAAEQVFDRLDKAVRNARNVPSEAWWERLARFLLGESDYVKPREVIDDYRKGQLHLESQVMDDY